MATMVDVGLIEVNSRILKRIEDNDEAVRGSAIPNWDALCAVSCHQPSKTRTRATYIIQASASF
jgi:hypothetical protein